MTRYLVSWEIDIDADNPTEAARKALAIQRDPESVATVFEVREYKEFYEIDLAEEL